MMMTAYLASLRKSIEERWPILARIVADDRGQDVVEYAFLAAFIGIAGWAVLMTIDETVGTAYTNWLNPTTGVPSVWESPEPLAGS